MSGSVALDELAKALRDYDFAYLLTTAQKGGPHVAPATPRLEGEVFVVPSVGRRSKVNALAHPGVTIVWPPAQRDGYSLIVDGDATEAAVGLRVVPYRAVLHRSLPTPAEQDGTPGACTSDCIELLPRPRTPSS